MIESNKNNINPTDPTKYSDASNITEDHYDSYVDKRTAVCKLISYIRPLLNNDR